MGKESFGKKLLKFFGMTMPEQEEATSTEPTVELLGNGCAITPTKGEVYAPCDGVISVVPDTLHAVGITSNTGADVLIHVGMNTVELKGKGYEMLVKEEQEVKKGDLILKFDIDTIKAAGLSTVTPVVINNADEYPTFKILPQPGEEVKVGDVLIQATK